MCSLTCFSISHLKVKTGKKQTTSVPHYILYPTTDMARVHAFVHSKASWGSSLHAAWIFSFPIDAQPHPSYVSAWFFSGSSVTLVHWIPLSVPLSCLADQHLSMQVIIVLASFLWSYPPVYHFTGSSCSVFSIGSFPYTWFLIFSAKRVWSGSSLLRPYMQLPLCDLSGH